MKLNFFEKIKLEVFLWCVQVLAMFPGQLSFLLRKFAFSKILANCGEYVSWGFVIDLRGCENIQIGNKFSCDRLCSIYSKNGLVKIGNNVSLNSSVSINADFGRMIVISDKCLIGPNVVIRSSHHKFEDKNNLIRNQGYTPLKAILKEDAWVGANSVILPRVVLSRGVVVEAGSVVTKSFPEYSLIASIPAKIIQSRS